MLKLWNDIVAVFSNFTLIDYILYIAVVTLIILVVSLIYVMKIEKETEEKTEDEINNIKEQQITKETEQLDLQHIAAVIDENPKPLIDMTAYEEEQEQKAIISYEELLERTNQMELKYDDEIVVDDVIPVKKLQLTALELPKTKEVTEERKESHLFFRSYEKEEAFLKTLKELNQLLNNT